MLSHKFCSQWISVSEENRTSIKHHTYMNNNEWRLFAYKVDIGTQNSFIDQKRFSILTISLAVQRNRPFYELTLFVPILVMTLLSPLGLILPGKFSFNRPHKTFCFSRRRRKNGSADNRFIDDDYLC